jgi:hypothetical protein
MAWSLEKSSQLVEIKIAVSLAVAGIGDRGGRLRAF